MKPEKKTTKKTAAPPAKFWSACVGVFFAFVQEKFSERPSFDGGSPRDLKIIVASLEERAKKAGVEWTEETACLRLKNFLEAAWRDDWLQRNFLLFNLNRQKDKIFFNSKNKTNGTTTHLGSTSEKPIASVQSAGHFGKL